jgi:hypothetical protein
MNTPRPLNILIVHGVGWDAQGKRYARPLQDNVRREFDRALRGLRLRDVNRPKPQDALRFEAVYWIPVTQNPQNALMRVLFGRPGLLSRIRLTYVFRRNLISLLGDVTAYERDPTNEVYQAVHREVEDCIRQLSEASAAERDSSGYAPLTVIGHSLGSVVASDFIWDLTRGKDYHLSAYSLALTNFVAMGSPMALYTLRRNPYGQRDSIREGLSSPILVDPDGGLWLNLYDRQDAIAFPLEPIESYQKIDVIDRPISVGNWLTGWNLLSHIGYWRSEEVARHIARKLALDWARINSPQFAERELEKANQALRRDLKRRS